jgi:hypothetical protein
MRAEAYIRAGGTEETIRSLHAETAIADASITRLKSKSPNGEFFWHWQIPVIALRVDDENADVRSLLLAHRPVFPIVKKYSVEADVYLEIVTRCTVGNDPVGLFLSAETIALLGEMGAALDHDVVVESRP